MNRPHRYRPLFPVDGDEILWEIWIEGFAEAVRLRSDAWQRFLDADPLTSDVMLGMLALTEVADGEHDLPEELVDNLTQAAPDFIPGWVVVLNNWRLANNRRGPLLEPAEVPPSAAAGRVGRNEPCPCGSGKNTRSVAGSIEPGFVAWGERKRNPPGVVGRWVSLRFTHPTLLNKPYSKTDNGCCNSPDATASVTLSTNASKLGARTI